jgi:hypothetical protein
VPSAEQILNGLREVANSWKAIAIAWHVYFGALALSIALGIHLSKRTVGVLLALPLLSVSAFAWLTLNPFNGVIFAAAGMVLVAVAAKLPRASIRLAPRWSPIPGVLLSCVRLGLPSLPGYHFVLVVPVHGSHGDHSLPTLIMVIGSTLLLDGLVSRTLGAILGVVGLLYGTMGVAYLHVTLDWVLILGGAVILVRAFTRKRNPITVGN